MKHLMTSLVLAVAVSGCGLMKKEKARSYAEWHQARARIICSVGEEHLKAGSLDKAQSCAMESISMAKDYLPARMLLCKVLLGRGSYEEASVQLREAEALSLRLAPDASAAPPKGAEIAYLLGEAMERTGRYAEALKCYQKARALAPASDVYVMASAEVLVAMGRPKGALELLEVRLQRAGPGAGPCVSSLDAPPSMFVLAGEVAMLTGAYEKAAEFFQQYLDMKSASDADESAKVIRESLAKAHFFAARAALADDSPREGKRHYRKALKQLQTLASGLSDDSSSASRSSWVYIMTGDSYMALNRPRKAKDAYEEAVKIEPADWPIWLSLAKAAVADGDWRRGVIAGFRALELNDESQAAEGSDPDKGRLEASIVVAYALLMDGKAEEAMRVLAQSARRHPNNPTLWCMLGRCYSARGQDDRAAACYMAALRSDPKHSLARSLLAKREGPGTRD